MTNSSLNNTITDWRLMSPNTAKTVPCTLDLQEESVSLLAAKKENLLPNPTWCGCSIRITNLRNWCSIKQWRTMQNLITLKLHFLKRRQKKQVILSVDFVEASPFVKMVRNHIMILLRISCISFLLNSVIYHPKTQRSWHRIYFGVITVRMSDCFDGIGPCKCKRKGHQFQRLGFLDALV